MTAEESALVTVIGLGNTLMGDDGVGVRVAEKVGALERVPGVRAIVGGVAGLALVPDVVAARRVIFVDAIDAGEPAGSVFRFDPDDVGVTQLRSNTSHGMSVGAIVTNARLLGARPDVTVYAVQVGDVTCRPDELTPAVADAASAVETMIAEEIEGLLGG